MLDIKNLMVSIEKKQILKEFNLSVKAGEVHAIMGPNGSGKSTLVNFLAGNQIYQYNSGAVNFNGKNILELDPMQRAVLGIYLAFQYPVEIPGVNNSYFLRTALNSIRKEKGLPLVDAIDFLTQLKQSLQIIGLDESFMQRDLNAGFSGGEKKRNEILQALVLQPKLMLLDETDSGLDIDALQVVAKGVNTMRAEDRAIVLVTHYQRLLNYIEPDVVHVMVNGQIVESGGKELAEQLESTGYAKWAAHQECS